VLQYIGKQEKHDRTRTFQKEYRQLLLRFASANRLVLDAWFLTNVMSGIENPEDRLLQRSCSAVAAIGDPALRIHPRYRCN